MEHEATQEERVTDPLVSKCEGELETLLAETSSPGKEEVRWTVPWGECEF